MASTVAEPVKSTTRLPAENLTSEAMVERIRGVVRSNAAQWKRLILLEAAGLAVAVPLGYLWLVFLLDQQLHLPTWGRWLASLGFVSLVAWGTILLVGRWRRLFLTEDQVALAIERRTSGRVQNRLINAVQLARDEQPDHAEFTRAVVEENYQQLQQIALEHAARARPAYIRAGIAAALILLGVGYWLWQPDLFGNSASRIFLPFANIRPIYRTELTVEPGNIQGMGDLAIRIRIEGERPRTLTILKNLKGSRSSESIPVEGKDTIKHVFKDVQQSFTYAVHGGDFTSPFYRVDVPALATLTSVRVRYQYPAYTRLPDKTQESTGGDLEALAGTRAKVTFVFETPPESVSLLLHRPGKGKDNRTERQALAASSAGEFSTEIVMKDVLGYQLEVKQAERPAQAGAWYTVRILADQEPRLELSGIDRQTETAVDAVLPIQVHASDDFGLEEVGLFVRRPGKTKEDAWQPLKTWKVKDQIELREKFDLSLSSLGVAEGEKVELVLQARDNDPSRAGRWTTGPGATLVLGGEGAILQIIYEQILRSEAELHAVMKFQQASLGSATEWLKKLNDAAINWEDAKNLATLTAAMKDQAEAQEKVRGQASAAARTMVAAAGTLKLSIGMLADTEMIRAIRILEAVAGRDNAQARRAALADARLTQDRIVRSLEEIIANYRQFRHDWELTNMIPFTKMLADRQAGLRDLSTRMTSSEQPALRQSTSRRQQKLIELAGLTSRAFAGLADRHEEKEAILGQAFRVASSGLKAAELTGAMEQAASAIDAGKWTDAIPKQILATEKLNAIHDALRKAQVEAARQALAALQDKAKSDLLAKQEIETLMAGNSDTWLNLPDKLKMEEIIRMREQTQDKSGSSIDKNGVENYLFPDSLRSILNPKDGGTRQDPNTLKLAKSPSGEMSFPKQSDRKGNRVTPPLQEKFEDLVGKLLDEVEENKKKFETYNINAAFNINEPGDIGKQAGDLNSTAASAATGNMKPPSGNFGGATRTGRQGARAHGMTVGDESINRRGRDKVQEGQEKVGDQAGVMREKKSEDPQNDTSTGIGGKLVDSEETKFSTADAGKWTDDMVKRMGKVQKKNFIVERQDGRFDPKTAEMLRDMTSQQEQIIERIKSVKKELKNLYLPTEHLDELLEQLKANLDRLKDRPGPEVFRLQEEALDKLRGAIMVFQPPFAGFQLSLPREQSVRGRVLDEPTRPTLPGYEDAVQQYYNRLTGR